MKLKSAICLHHSPQIINHRNGDIPLNDGERGEWMVSLVVKEESSVHPYLVEQKWEPLVKRSWDLRVIVGHTCQHGHMISLCSHWELSWGVGGCHFLVRKRQRFLRSSFFPLQGKTPLFCPASLPFSHLSSCQKEKQNTQGPPISSMVVRPSSQDLWSYRFERYLSLTICCLSSCPILTHLLWPFSYPCIEECHK